MTIRSRPSATGSLAGAAIPLQANRCDHEPARPTIPWRGDPGTAGTVVVVGAGKMGLPLAAQYAGHGWQVIAVDIDPNVVDAINAGRSHVLGEPERDPQCSPGF